MQKNQDGVDYEDPRSIMERSEEETQPEGVTVQDFSAALGRTLAFLVDGHSLSNIGLRVMVACKKLRPDLIDGVSLEDIAQMAGFGRSQAHKLSKEFEGIFGIRGMHDKSKKARASYAKAWVKANRPTVGGAA